MRASVQFASRCGGTTSIPPHHCASFHKCCTMIRSSRRFAAAAARAPHALHTPYKHQNWRSHGAREDASRTPCEHPKWCSHGARGPCDLQAA
eukprot:2166267-Lingulodinium_polyedra.AAC.1